MEYFSEYASPIGALFLTGNEDALTGVYIQSNLPQRMHMAQRDIRLIAQVKAWLDGYFRGEKNPISVPLSPCGSPFQMQVWKLLQDIPFGQTVTYGELAKRISPTMSAQAVGQAVGKNPISILIPCHRVIGADGTLVGYAGGLEKKAWLLRHEEAHK